MARVKVHALCLRPLSECDCPDDDDEPGAPDAIEVTTAPGLPPGANPAWPYVKLPGGGDEAA